MPASRSATWLPSSATRRPTVTERAASRSCTRSDRASARAGELTGTVLCCQQVPSCRAVSVSAAMRRPPSVLHSDLFITARKVRPQSIITPAVCPQLRLGGGSTGRRTTECNAARAQRWDHPRAKAAASFRQGAQRRAFGTRAASAGTVELGAGVRCLRFINLQRRAK